MDDRRFDSLVKALAEGKSRRSVLKGLLGLGGAVATGGTLVGRPAEAARRPTPTPTPIKCPGNQTPVGGVCTCPAGTAQCNPNGGPACCPTGIAPGAPGYSECCDNACCQGTCYGEELCCATNSRAGGLPPTNWICDTTTGPECCAASDQCCLVDGCCATVCTGGASGLDSCCPVEDFCPGGTESPDLCCTGGATCCGSGTNANACVDLSVPGNCCIEDDCGDPCQVCHPMEHVCVARCDAATEVCCADASGALVCVLAETCDCDQLCGPVETGINTGSYYCCTEPDYTICCDGPESECCGGPAGRECNANGHCCEENQFECNGVCVADGTPCSDCAVDDDCGACAVCMNGNCAPCEAVGNICCNDVCANAQCCDAGDCVVQADVCLDAQGVNICLCLDGICVPGTGATCTDSNDCDTGEVCCESECVAAECCTAADCVVDADLCVVAGLNICLCVAGLCEPQVTPECTVAADCTGDDECVACQGGSCVAVNPGGSCNGGAGICDDVFCVNPPSDGCSPGCDGDDECVECQNAECVAVNQGGSCNGGAGICSDVYCVECVTDDQCGSGAVCCDNVCFAGECCFADDCLTVAAGLCATTDPLVNLCTCAEAHVCIPL